MKQPPMLIADSRLMPWSVIDERHRPTSDCRHFVAGELAHAAVGLAICRNDEEGAFYLFGCDSAWDVITDTWHQTLEEAPSQAEFEYEGISATWNVTGGNSMSVELNGIAHIQLTVNDAQRCLPFWEKLCHFFEMRTLIKGENVLYCIGSRTGILVREAPDDKRETRFDQDRAGLHHFCFRARSREHVDAVHRFLVDELDAHIVHPPEDGSHFAPGYYSVLFEDPDGIRVEVNHVPGKGHFGPGGRLGPEGQGPATRYGSEGLGGSRKKS